MKDFTNAYIYKYGFIYVGWVLVHKEGDTPLYYDNTLYENLYTETKIKYLCFSISKRRAFKKLEKWLKKKV